jgi:hypothetical protein
MKNMLHEWDLMNNKFIYKRPDTTQMLKEQHIIAMTFYPACIKAVEWTFSVKQLKINLVVLVQVLFLSVEKKEFYKSTDFR